MSFTWPWHFTSLTDAEKQQRRELLDLRGLYAQCSVLVALVLVRVYKKSFSEAPGSEKPAERRSRRKNSEKSWLDTPPIAGWMETRRQYIVCLIWLGWLLSLCIWKSGEGGSIISVTILDTTSTRAWGIGQQDYICLGSDLPKSTLCVHLSSRLTTTILSSILLSPTSWRRKLSHCWCKQIISTSPKL